MRIMIYREIMKKAGRESENERGICNMFIILIVVVQKRF